MLFVSIPVQLILAYAVFMASSLHTTLFIFVNILVILGLKVNICSYFTHNHCKYNEYNSNANFMKLNRLYTFMTIYEQRLNYGSLCKGYKWVSTNNHLKISSMMTECSL